MPDPTLSQAEIDALLATQDEPPRPASRVNPPLAPADRAQVQAAAERALQEAWALSGTLLGEGAEIGPVAAASGGVQEVQEICGPQVIWCAVELGEEAPAWLALSAPLASVMVALMQGIAPSAEWSNADAGALAEALGQLSAKGLARLYAAAGRNLMPGPVAVHPPGSPGPPAGDGPWLVLHHTVMVGDAQGAIALLLPVSAAGAVARELRATGAVAEPARAGPRSHGGRGGDGLRGPGGFPETTTGARAAPPVSYAPARFFELGDGTAGDVRNIELLLDVSLQVTVELGRTRRQIRDVLTLGPGSVVELDKLAGEPVDVLVNGKRIARGEVVVIDEHFGVRITDIVSPVERAQSLRP